MSVTPEAVRQVASLARLSLDEDELAELAADLNNILGHMDVLAAADVDGGAAPPDAVRPAPLRADEPEVDRLAAEPGGMARDFVHGFFTVPRLRSHEGADDGGGAS